MTPEEDQAAFSTQYDQQQAAEAQKADASKAPPTLGQRFAVPQAPVTTSMLDSIVAEAQNWGTAAKRVGQDAVAGATTGAVNIADAAGSAISTSGKEMAAEADPAHAAEAEAGTLPTSPIWDHAKAHILDFRDAVAVKDPNIVDRLTQGVAQLAVPFAGYSRVLSGLHGVANMVVAGGATDLTALAPHDMRTADVLSLGRQTEGKLGEVLRTLAPDGSAQNAYINFLADRGNESEALGRFKNVLDGFGVNLIATPLLSAVATTLKQGTAGLRYMVDNGVGSAGDFMPAGSPASQRGSIGYHGTPSAPFDEFDNSKIGSGQGAQSYGYGHYIAENAATGETYQKALTTQMHNSPELRLAKQAVDDAGGDKVKALNVLKDQQATFKNSDTRDVYTRAQSLIKSGNVDRGKGSLLKVNIDDKHIESMLDLDKPLAKQPDILSKIPMKEQAKLQQVLDDHGQDLELGELTGHEFRQLIERAHNESYLPPTNGELYPETGSNPDTETSEYLSSRGIPGNKYLDRVSRVTGEGTRNYVVFDGKHIKVLKGEK